MENKTFIPDYKGLTLTEKATMEEPTPLFYSPNAASIYNRELEAYQQHLASLRTLPAPWLDKDLHPWKELIEGVHFAFEYYRHGSGGLRQVSKFIYEASPLDLRGQIIAVPLPRPLEGETCATHCDWPNCTLPGCVSKPAPITEVNLLVKQHRTLSEAIVKRIASTEDALLKESYSMWLDVLNQLIEGDRETLLTAFGIPQSTPAPVPVIPENANGYLVYKDDKVNSLLAACMRELNTEQMISLRNALIERTPAPVQGEAVYPASFTEWVDENASQESKGNWWLHNDPERFYTTAELFNGPYQEWLKTKV